MSYSNQSNLRNHASLSRKIYSYVSQRNLLELNKELLTSGIPLFRKFIGLYFDKNFDQKHQVDTCGSIHLYELTVDRDDTESCTIYDPIPARTIRNLISSIPRDFSDYTFIEPIWDLFLKCFGFMKAVLTSLVTVGIQETEKSFKMTARIMKPRWVLDL